MIDQIIIHICFGIIAYLIGSIQFGIISGKLSKGIDIRQYGSGGTGATNIGRIIGLKVATAVALLDIGKGFFVVLLLTEILKYFEIISSYSITTIGAILILGHCWPIYYKFKGGKGVLTSLGIFFLVDYQVTILALAVFVLTLIIFRYVSLGSLTGVTITLLYVIFSISTSFGNAEMPDLLFTLFIFCVIFYRHKENIHRLRQGNENKIGKSDKSSKPQKVKT